MRFSILVALLSVVSCAPRSAKYKQDVTRWYDAFNKRTPAFLDDLLADNWVDLPPAPGQPNGRDGAKQLLVVLTTTFPDFKATIEDILQDGNKVVVRSTLSGTQAGPFTGIPSKGRALRIQAVDIHEFQNGKVVRTWHTEDWMTGFRQLGILE
jgi:steroid delta-isomerase-like uncharacterized protein